MDRFGSRKNVERQSKVAKASGPTGSSAESSFSKEYLPGLPDELQETVQLVKASFEFKLLQRLGPPGAESSMLTPALKERLLETVHEDIRNQQAALKLKR